jgi:hypothetical protein
VYFSCVSQFQNPPNYLLRIAGRELQGTIPKYIGLLYDRLEVLDLGKCNLGVLNSKLLILEPFFSYFCFVTTQATTF